MIYDDDYPTDWFAFHINVENANKVSMKKTIDGYVLEADNFQNVKVEANNRTYSPEVRFSTEYDEVLLYEIDVHTIGVAVDKDGNGTYETTIAKSGKSEIYGDINLDGTLNIADAVLMQKYQLNCKSFSKYQWETADLDSNGSVDVFDMVRLRRALITIMR